MQGFTKVFSKIIDRQGIIKSGDMSPDEKKRLYAFFERYEAGQYFVYDRFFQNGFKQWEIIGIDNIKKTFLHEHQEDITAAIADELNPVTSDEVTMVELYNRRGDFFSMIVNVRGLRSALYSKMAELGMTSNATALPRFRDDNWKAWERKGIRAILQEFIQTEQCTESPSQSIA